MTAPVTAIVTAFDRVEHTLETLRQLRSCDPAPAQILVHVDAAQRSLSQQVRAAHPGVDVLVSDERIGPGGGRNRLVTAAAHPLVASFDDDAYPIDPDYFARVVTIAERFPAASVIAPRLFLRNETVRPRTEEFSWVSDYCGAACVFRRDEFLAAGGYVPVPIAYGVEEVDLALRLYARGRRILHTSALRAFHDTTLSHHASDAVTAASVSNLALLAYLRYPPILWAIGAAQVIARIGWLIRHRRWRGIASGLAQIPGQLGRYRGYRHIVRRSDVMGYLQFRHQPQVAESR